MPYDGDRVSQLSAREVVMQPQVDVVVVVIEREKRFLLGRRSLKKASAPGYWAPVCGRVEPGESEASAVEREVAEEVGLRVRALEKLAVFESRDRSARLHWWRAAPLDGAVAFLANDEHDTLVWVNVEEMRRLVPMFPEDVAVFAGLARATPSGA
jgi:8-oxo-dGTP diphosphatase